MEDMAAATDVADDMNAASRLRGSGIVAFCVAIAKHVKDTEQIPDVPCLLLKGMGMRGRRMNRRSSLGSHCFSRVGRRHIL
mmetsp:Transcript_28076/g.59272  ORF Transcript_28076/g.59272 Transcript_28076/m.59272 type:complete len:81 (+) Transcript_28076:2-244(+)